MVVLRLSSVASAGAIHLFCGAARVPFATFMAGTVDWAHPAVAALSGLGGLLRDAFLEPSLSNGASPSVRRCCSSFLARSALRTFLLIRQFAPSVSLHRNRAEFG